jgi:hypothetical protein
MCQNPVDRTAETQLRTKFHMLQQIKKERKKKQINMLQQSKKERKKKQIKAPKQHLKRKNKHKDIAHQSSFHQSLPQTTCDEHVLL